MKTTDKYVLFWNGIYSNWYSAAMMIDGVLYKCVEQYMMAEKAKLFEDTKNLKKIMATNSPKEMKALGRKVKNFNGAEWDKVKYDVVLVGCYEKFRQHKTLREQLFATGDRIFVEASPYDRIWGIGLRENDALALDERTWRGQNLLGKALTEARELLREES